MLNDYLLKGIDIEALKTDSPGIIKVTYANKEDDTDLRRDIRVAIIHYLKGLEE